MTKLITDNQNEDCQNASTSRRSTRSSKSTLIAGIVAAVLVMAVGSVAAAPNALVIARLQSQAAPTPPVGPGDEVLELTPAPRAVGWARSDDSRNNRFGNSFLYTGVSQGQIFHGGIQFDLSDLPRGAPVRYAALVLTGLDDARLDRTGRADWEVRWLSPEVNENWSRITFQDLHNAPVFQTILPPVDAASLQPGGVNSFTFSEAQLRALEKARVR